MKKINTSPISGMQELLPDAQANFQGLIEGAGEWFLRHGYRRIETPVIDRTEILLAKAGGDTEKQIYRVVKTNEAAEGADQALRFDHTVPLARYVVEHENDLAFPFKVFQIGRNFRGERAQKGRFREFYQADVDVVGRGSLPVAYDADVIGTLVNVLSKGFRVKRLRVRVSNRKILSGFLEELGLSGKAKAISSIIDHAEKVPREKTLAAFSEEGLSAEEIRRVVGFMEINGGYTEALGRLRELEISNEKFREGVEELEEAFRALEAQGLVGGGFGNAGSGEGGEATGDLASGAEVVVDMAIIRGLDYYTGTVFETFVPGHEEIGSICSGGRYENLAGLFTDQKLPGVGGSIGLTRLFYLMNEFELAEREVPDARVEFMVAPITEADAPFAFKLAERIRAEGRSADVALAGKRLGDKLSYAAKTARNAVVVGENEAKGGEIVVKNLETGEKQALAEYLR